MSEGWFLLKTVRRNLFRALLPDAGGLLAIFDISWLTQASPISLPWFLHDILPVFIRGLFCVCFVSSLSFHLPRWNDWDLNTTERMRLKYPKISPWCGVERKTCQCRIQQTISHHQVDLNEFLSMHCVSYPILIPPSAPKKPSSPWKVWADIKCLWRKIIEGAIKRREENIVQCLNMLISLLSIPWGLSHLIWTNQTLGCPALHIYDFFHPSAF